MIPFDPTPGCLSVINYSRNYLNVSAIAFFFLNIFNEPWQLKHTPTFTKHYQIPKDWSTILKFRSLNSPRRKYFFWFIQKKPDHRTWLQFFYSQKFLDPKILKASQFLSINLASIRTLSYAVHCRKNWKNAVWKSVFLCIFMHLSSALHFECRFNQNSLLQCYFLVFLLAEYP